VSSATEDFIKPRDWHSIPFIFALTLTADKKTTGQNQPL
jgi:hypothetical protein